MPGMYTVRLIVNGKAYSQLFTIKMDPRVKTSIKNLQLQHDLSLMCYNNALKCMNVLKDITGKKDYAKYLDTFLSIQGLLQEGDMPPTTQMINAAMEAQKGFDKLIQKK